MDIVEIYQNISNFLANLWASLQGLYDTIILFFEVIPEPFRTIILIFIPIFLIALIVKIKSNI